MVFIALNTSINKSVLASNSSKNDLYKCLHCKEKLIFICTIKTQRLSHFRHEKTSNCLYRNEHDINYNFYISDFHIKWTKS